MTDKASRSTRAPKEPRRVRGQIQVLPTDQPPEGATSPDAKPRLSFAVPPAKGKAPRHLADLDLAGRKSALKEAGLPAFRADQLSRHYFTHFTRDAEDMTDIPAAIRHQVCEDLLPELLTEVTALHADRGKTIKYLWQLFDGVRVESVLMRYKDRTTLCVSSEAGCGMACPFCATGQMGLTRNLSTAEIIEQVRHAALASERGDLVGGPARLSNVVFMGMGEPMVNYKAVVQALRRLIEPAPEGFGLSARNITVSTVGLVPLIKKLATEGMPVTLAVSLHAPDDELRDALIPVNSRWKVGELLDAAYHYYEVTGRRVSIEYALIKDMNDHQWRAQLLADELNARGRGWAHVNPIPLNPTPGSIWTCSLPSVQERFVETLRHAGITTTVRDTRGSDIDGACGQLATAVLEGNKSASTDPSAKSRAAASPTVEPVTVSLTPRPQADDQ
ncbi:23S rRNA (adenine(2503)-C(2))-methyltransferase RlmN [Actinomyces vulturis]|uniref:23S rRNA (adenine(2503)-C(2))-methyltransferase RlmN n=1 Tax=Actinomyces vulturis TaxID=1857645 RepID=UPI0009F3A39E|nr:23S rRNA (adenine(2503)-C(2))-methyltransferase RlmN [Actinomyces vulturis]